MKKLLNSLAFLALLGGPLLAAGTARAEEPPARAEEPLSKPAGVALGEQLAATDEPPKREEPGEPPYSAKNAELFTWLTPILPAAEQDAIRKKIEKIEPKTYIDKKPFVAEGQLTPMLMAGVAFLLVLIGAWLTRRQLAASEDAGVLPARKFGVFFFYEAIIGAVWNLMKGMMGPEEARRHFPIIGTLAFYIFTMNALALIPGGSPATANLNTNIVMGLTVFLATHISGIRVQGVVGYAKHFMGPMLALAPLMVVVELISHMVRPLSLSLRLLGNMTGDHKVLEIFLGFHVPFLPLPLMFLGLLVVCIQTMVFVLLSTVYLALAVEKHEHGDDAHAREAHGH